MITPKSILITIDVEDWFQVENFKPYIPFSSWPERELRVERNVHKLLNLFEEVRGQRTEGRGQRTEGRGQRSEGRGRKTEAERWKLRRWEGGKVGGPRPHCTFFILGWIAEKLPKLVGEIHARGHEVASHGCNHDLANQLSANQLKQDLLESKNQLEDITGAPVFGYRAPSFAINDDILKIIEDAGYLYDSSYNSFNLHDRYGQISLNGSGKKGIAHKLSDNFYELPISNLSIKEKRFVLPWGGGGYFRLLPFSVFNWGIKVIFKRQNAYIFYVHPWEVDPDQPRVEKASVGFKFRHYNNLGKTHSRLRALIASFNSCSFMTCKEYLNSKV